MNKMIKVFLIAVTIVIAFGAVGSVYAQGGGPIANAAPGGQSFGNGFRGGNGERLNQYQGSGPGTMDGVLHEVYMTAYAEALGIEVEDLEARIAAGETMSEIALSLGFTIEDFRDLRMEIRTSVIEQALADGTLTQEQADWMKTRSAGMRNGMGRRGLGMDNEGCPYSVQNP